MEKKRISLGLVDDHVLFRRGLLSIMEKEEGIAVLWEAGNGQEVIDLLEKGQHPDVLLLDLKMPVMDGIATARHLRSHYPGIKIIVLTMFDDDKFIIQLIELDVDGYLLKDCEATEMLLAIRLVFNQQGYFGSKAVNAMQKKLKANAQSEIKPTRPLVAPVAFSTLERTVLKMVCQARTTSEIAKVLGMSARTIDGYRNRLMRKTNTKNSASMVAYALANYLLD